ncbi:MAG: hypothetical protein ACFFKA_06830, partial [Candidatus Thorarchaeota archaeon]
LNVVIEKEQGLKIQFEPNILDGINIIHGNTSNRSQFTAIPYYAWNNRGPDKMQVWMKIKH